MCRVQRERIQLAPYARLVLQALPRLMMQTWLIRKYTPKPFHLPRKWTYQCLLTEDHPIFLLRYVNLLVLLLKLYIRHCLSASSKVHILGLPTMLICVWGFNLFNLMPFQKNSISILQYQAILVFVNGSLESAFWPVFVLNELMFLTEMKKRLWCIFIITCFDDFKPS